MRLSEAITQLVTATEAEGRSVRTSAGYRRNLQYLVDCLGDREVETITIADLRSYAAALRGRTQRFAEHPTATTRNGGLSVYTIASYLRSVKRLFAWLVDEGVLAVNPALRLKIPAPARREPKAISPDDLQRILAATAGATPDQLRDRAIVLFLADTGCRVGGLCGLRVVDVDLAAGSARITEKRQKTRLVFFSPATRDALSRWLAVRPASGDALWLGLGPRQHHQPLTPEGVKEVLRRLKRVSGATGPCNPHAFRHGFAREWIRNGGDLATLASILGHEDPAVTARFYAVFADHELGEFHRRYSPIARLFGPDEGAE